MRGQVCSSSLSKGKEDVESLVSNFISELMKDGGGGSGGGGGHEGVKGSCGCFVLFGAFR